MAQTIIHIGMSRISRTRANCNIGDYIAHGSNYLASHAHARIATSVNITSNIVENLASHAHARNATLTFIYDDNRASQNVKANSLRVAHKSILRRYVLPLPPD